MPARLAASPPSSSNVPSSGAQPTKAGAAHASGIVMAPKADRQTQAAGAVAAADALLARGLLEQAGERYQAASRTYDELGDAAGSARALLGLGRVLLGLEDPSCRQVLEDAGTFLEDLGDERAVLEVDKLLRIAEKSIEESPRSFHAATIAYLPRRTPTRR